MKENLRRFLEKHKGDLTTQEQIRISLEITRGVAFLHQLKPPMVHRDLNDKNVMLTFDGVAKDGDFGQSKLKQDLYLTSERFDHEGLHQLQNSFVADKDLRGRNVLLLTSLSFWYENCSKNSTNRFCS